MLALRPQTTDVRRGKPRHTPHCTVLPPGECNDIIHIPNKTQKQNKRR